jgi:Ferric reductase like transmembrane component
MPIFDMKHVGTLLAISHLALAQQNGKPKQTPAEIAEQAAAEVLNYQLPRNYFLSLAAFACIFIAYRMTIVTIQNFRTVACLFNDTQRYFAIPSPRWAKVKSMILYAPLFRTRHNREFKLSAAVNMGTLPSRFQSLFIAAIVATNVVLCVYGIRWSSPRGLVLSVLRNRTGTISVANLIPMVLMAGRNNPLIPLLNVSFDSFNMMHRWLGRLAILEAIAHTLCWMISKVDKGISLFPIDHGSY